MYETSLPYADLKNILDDLIVQNEVEDINVKTYKFIGSIDRNFGEVDVEALDTLCEDDTPDEDEGMRISMKMKCGVNGRNILKGDAEN